MDMMKRTPIAEQDPKVRATNFDEVCLGYTEDEAVEEAGRCLNCKNPRCVGGCPVSINIPAFIQEVKNRNFEKAYEIISESSALPAVCGRVCPQESQCEGVCVRGIKGEAVAIGKLERFVADWARKNGIKPKAPQRTVTKLPSSVQVLPDLPVQAILQRLATMLQFSRHFTRQAAFLSMAFLNSGFQRTKSLQRKLKMLKALV